MMIKGILSIRCKCKLITKVIVRQNTVRARYEESFQYRILDYFDNTWKIHEASLQYAVSTQINQNRHENDIKKKKFESICKYIEQIQNSTDLQSSEKFVNDLDTQCSSMINFLRHSEILNLLNAVLKLLPNALTQTNFYSKSIIVLLEATESELLSNNEIVQLLFFISLKKFSGADYINYLKYYLPYINDLSLIDKCIVAQAFYKSSVKLEQCQSRLLEEVIEKEYERLVFDPLLLVSLCKAVRISGPSKELNLNNLSKEIINLETPFNFTTVTHVLCLYAEALLHEPKAVDRLVEDAIEMIRQDDIKCSLRLKDVDRFLWSISRLGLTLTPNKKIVLQMYLEQRLNEYKTKPNLGILVNSILCLHVLQCWHIKIIKHLLQECTFVPVIYEKFHWKVRSRLQLLINLITLEMKMTVPQVLRKQREIAYTPSENVNLVAEAGSTMVNKGILKNAIVECPIPTLQIPGVTLITENYTYHVDVLDNLTCLRNTNIPHGLMNLKLRLLTRLKYRQILISNEVFNDPVTALSVIEQQIVNNIADDKH